MTQNILTPLERIEGFLERIEGFLERKPHMIGVVTQEMEGKDRETLSELADFLDELKAMTPKQLTNLKKINEAISQDFLAFIAESELRKNALVSGFYEDDERLEPLRRALLRCLDLPENRTFNCKDGKIETEQ